LTKLLGKCQEFGQNVTKTVLASTLPLTYETGVSNLSFTCTC